MRSALPLRAPVRLAGGVNREAAEIIVRLGLAPLPREGGFFRQIAVDPERLPGGRARSSVIWFLMTEESFSALHRLQAEERWEFHEGDPVEHWQLDPRTGAAKATVLGKVSGEQRVTVPGGVWQGARLAGAARRGWALLRCTMTPAWDEAEFELGRREELLPAFPAAAERIAALTR
jgi:hypothetical protein